MLIRSAQPSDATAIATIYNHYINHSEATFEVDEIDASIIQARMSNEDEGGLPWLVALDDDGEILGYAYAAPFKERLAYRFSAEVTVYLAPNTLSKGLGTKLYSALFLQLRDTSIHSVIAGITVPNAASVALHEKFGLTQVAHFKEVGFKFERWLDVGYWQANLSEVRNP